MLFSHSVVSKSMQSCSLQHARLPCPSLSPWAVSIEPVMPSNHLILVRPALNLSQHQELFQWVSSWNQVAKIGASALASVFLMNIQSWFPLEFIDLISLLSEGLSRDFFSTIIWKPQVFGVQSSLCFNCQICTWLLEKP